MQARFVIIASVVMLAYILLGGVAYLSFESSYAYDNRSTMFNLSASDVSDSIAIEQLFNFVLESIAKEYLWNISVALSNSTTSTNVVMVAGSKTTAKPWSFYDAVLCALTIVTTIGYGMPAPITFSGRLFTCFYALLGVPMMGSWFATAGQYLMQEISKVESISLKRHKSLRSIPHRTIVIIRIVGIFIIGSGIFMLVPSAVFSYMESWVYLDAFYFSIITLLTIGLGDFVAGYQPDAPGWYRAFFLAWILIGMSWLSLIVSLVIRAFNTQGPVVVKAASHKVAENLKRVVMATIKRYDDDKPVRRNSFSGKRNISVLESTLVGPTAISDSRKSSAAQENLLTPARNRRPSYVEFQITEKPVEKINNSELLLEELEDGEVDEEGWLAMGSAVKEEPKEHASSQRLSAVPEVDSNPSSPLYKPRLFISRKSVQFSRKTSIIRPPNIQRSFGSFAVASMTEPIRQEYRRSQSNLSSQNLKRLLKRGSIVEKPNSSSNEPPLLQVTDHGIAECLDPTGVAVLRPRSASK